jgi:hypothetical protein
MKFLFVDEFKYPIPGTSSKVYGLVGVSIDAIHYQSFKKSFHKELEKIGWDKHLELKGRSMFSSDGNTNVKVGDRIGFMEKVVDLSKSSTGKSAKIQVYVSFDDFDTSEGEFECYLKNLKKIIGKLPRPVNKKKSLTAVFYDRNDCVDVRKLNVELDGDLEKRGLCLFESPYSVHSSLEYPGIMFADYVCYFHQAFFQLRRFGKENMEKLIRLIEKGEKQELGESEKKQLNEHVKNYKKQETTKKLILSLRKIIYV